MNYGKYQSKYIGKKSLLKRVLTSPFSLILVVIIFIFITKATWGLRYKVILSDTKLGQARTELANLQSRETDLTAQVAHLSTEQGVESEIRTKFKGVREGESLAVIIGNDANATSQQASSTPEKVGWFRSLLQKIGL